MQNINDFIEECLREHNAYRELHGVVLLKHSRALDKTAQDWADELISEDGIKNSALSSHGEVGESISMRTSTGLHVDVQGADIIAQWYADCKNYNYNTGKGPSGNFTQLVWSGTREVGFGKSCAPGKCVVVAHYRPPGNIIGRYLENVFRPLNASDADDTTTSENPVSDAEAGLPKRVIIQTITDSDGRKYNIRKEITETTDENGKIRQCVNQVYSEADQSRFEKQNKEQEEMDIFIHNVVQYHNEYRQKHGSASLTYNQHLANLAQQWADHLVNEPHLSNSGLTYGGMRLGESIGNRWSNGRADYSSKELIDCWYQECEKYKFDVEPQTIQGIGNFTQLVWAATKQIGIGRAIKSQSAGPGRPRCSKVTIVCLYYPPGNVKGRFRTNVRQALA